MQRAYRQQLNAPRVHLWRVILCSGDWDSYRHLRALYAFIDKGAQDPDFWENNREMFWGKYWQVEQGHQPWLVAHLHRSIGLREGDPFYQNPVNNRTWLYSDMKDRHIPCQMIWSWLQAAANERLESACLLSSYTHTELHEELTRRAKAGYDDQDMGYFFVSMTVAMVYRMTLESLAQEFEQESHSWKAMFAGGIWIPDFFYCAYLAPLNVGRAKNICTNGDRTCFQKPKACWTWHARRAYILRICCASGTTSVALRPRKCWT